MHQINRRCIIHYNCVVMTVFLTIDVLLFDGFDETTSDETSHGDTISAALILLTPLPF